MWRQVPASIKRLRWSSLSHSVSRPYILVLHPWIQTTTNQKYCKDNCLCSEHVPFLFPWSLFPNNRVNCNLKNITSHHVLHRIWMWLKVSKGIRESTQCTGQPQVSFSINHLRQGLMLSLELNNWVGWLASSCRVSSNSRVLVNTRIPSYMGTTGHTNWSPQILEAGSWLTEPFFIKDFSTYGELVRVFNI